MVDGQQASHVHEEEASESLLHGPRIPGTGKTTNRIGPRTCRPTYFTNILYKQNKIKRPRSSYENIDIRNETELSVDSNRQFVTKTKWRVIADKMTFSWMQLVVVGR